MKPAAWILAALFAATATWWYFAPQTLPTALRHALPVSPSAATNPSPPLYKWRDAKGRLNVTDTPPADRPYETLRYDPNTNVVPAYRNPADPPSN